MRQLLTPLIRILKLNGLRELAKRREMTKVDEMRQHFRSPAQGVGAIACLWRNSPSASRTRAFNGCGNGSNSAWCP